MSSFKGIEMVNLILLRVTLIVFVVSKFNSNEMFS